MVEYRIQLEVVVLDQDKPWDKVAANVIEHMNLYHRVVRVELDSPDDDLDLD